MTLSGTAPYSIKWQNWTFQITSTWHPDMIFKSVIIGKLTYAASAWWCFTTADARQRLESVIRIGIRSGLYAADPTSLADLVEDADDNLFNSILYSNDHVLNRILPTKTESTYQLRPRHHNRSLTMKANATHECDFIVRMLFQDIY